MHTNDVSHRATAVFSVKCFNQLKVYPLSGTILRKQCASYTMLPRADADDERAAVVGSDLNIHIEDLGDSDGVRLAELLDQFGLTQRVLGPTHQRGGTLDLVVVPQDIADVPTVTPGIISDHGLVVADLPTRPVYQAARLQVCELFDVE